MQAGAASRECVECARIEMKAVALIRELRAVAGSIAIVLTLLLTELLFVALAHDSFGRNEDPTKVLAVLGCGGALCLGLFVFALRGKQRGPSTAGDGGVLATLSGAHGALCSRAHTLGLRGYLRYLF